MKITYNAVETAKENEFMEQRLKDTLSKILLPVVKTVNCCPVCHSQDIRISDEWDFTDSYFRQHRLRCSCKNCGSRFVSDPYYAHIYLGDNECFSDNEQKFIPDKSGKKLLQTAIINLICVLGLVLCVVLFFSLFLPKWQGDDPVAMGVSMVGSLFIGIIALILSTMACMNTIWYCHLIRICKKDNEYFQTHGSKIYCLIPGKENDDETIKYITKLDDWSYKIPDDFLKEILEQSRKS